MKKWGRLDVGLHTDLTTVTKRDWILLMYVLTCFYFRLYPLVDEKRLTEFTTGATCPLVQCTGTEFQITFRCGKRPVAEKSRHFNLLDRQPSFLAGASCKSPAMALLLSILCNLLRCLAVLRCLADILTSAGIMTTAFLFFNSSFISFSHPGGWAGKRRLGCVNNVIILTLRKYPHRRNSSRGRDCDGPLRPRGYMQIPHIVC